MLLKRQNLIWCNHANVGDSNTRMRVSIADDIICDESGHSSTSSDCIPFGYIANHPPLPGTVVEDGKHVCVIIPRQIKDAAARLGMKSLLDSHSIVGK